MLRSLHPVGMLEFRQVIYGLHVAAKNVFRRVATIESIGGGGFNRRCATWDNLRLRVQAIYGLPKFKCRSAAK
jgi:hypothetical protein